jgi:FkbM family methyltransferase
MPIADHSTELEALLARSLTGPATLPEPSLIAEARQKKRPVILYPGARMGQQACTVLTRLGFDVIGFGDSDPRKAGQSVHAHPTFDSETIAAQFPEAVVFVASSLYDTAIRARLARAGCAHVVPMPLLNHWFPTAFVSREYHRMREQLCTAENHPLIRRASALWADEESRRVFVEKLRFYLTFEKSHLDRIRSPHPIYFDPEFSTAATRQIVVDGGAFVGDTFRDFARIAQGNFRRYYAFEPNELVQGALADATREAAARVEIVRAGLGRSSGSASFIASEQGDGKISENPAAGSPIDLIALDEFFASRPHPTLIKMDIEGAEAEALLGARNLLATTAPVLAFSVYHHPSDLWQLPALAKALQPRYRLALRHYSQEVDDTVCYAVPAEP